MMAIDWFHAVAAASAAAWLVLIAARGGFWRADVKLSPAPGGREAWPGVVAVIPARNESVTIGRTLSSLLRQTYPGDFHAIVVDDDSTDGTGDIARRAGGGTGQVTVLDGAPLEAGWTGKLWAVHQGLQHVEDVLPAARYVLLTDADIEHDPYSIRRLVNQAETGNYDLVSVMVRLHCRNFWERLLMPAFVFFFQKLFPFSWVGDSRRSTAAAAGGCMLARRSALNRIGGVRSIRGRLIDDCALAKAIKKNGSIWLGLSETIASSREYGSLREIWNMVSRTAYEQLRYSPLLLATTVLGMGLIYLAPVAALAGGAIIVDPVLFLCGLLAWGTMMWAYRPTLALYGRSWGWGLVLPVIGGLYVLMTVDSACRTWQGRGGGWKNRHYGTIRDTG